MVDEATSHHKDENIFLGAIIVRPKKRVPGREQYYGTRDIYLVHRPGTYFCSRVVTHIEVWSSQPLSDIVYFEIKF